MGTSERRLKMMKYLCQKKFASMPVLAAEFGVSVRTIKRDIDELGDMIPLEIKTGRYTGGVYVMQGYAWDKAYMSEEDVALLKTIRHTAENGGELCLIADALRRLDNLIQTYSAPTGK